MNKNTKENEAKSRLEALKPKRIEYPKEELTDFYPKDKFFNRKKTYLPNSNSVKEFDANWRKVCVSGHHLILYKGEPLTHSELGHFSKEEKESWLEKRSKKS